MLFQLYSIKEFLNFLSDSLVIYNVAFIHHVLYLRGFW
jgi:hypothetical protein